MLTPKLKRAESFKVSVPCGHSAESPLVLVVVIVVHKDACPKSPSTT